jgi:ribosomal subunit interface protein
MNIAIYGQGFEVKTQARAYVEYRMFSALGRFGRRCMPLRIRLEASDAQVGTRYRCAAALDLVPRARVRARATADRLYAAIDQSAPRLSLGMERRLQSGHPRTRRHRRES